MESSINTNLLQLFQFLAILFTGLLAGLFYGFDCSVIKGLGNLSNDIYLKSFQSINKAIQNPYFFISFMGSILVLPVATWLSYKNNSTLTFCILLFATLIYFIAVFGVTILGNIPLNERLANFKIASATESEITSIRQIFEKPWNFYHRIRTFASIIVFALTILSLLKQKL